MKKLLGLLSVVTIIGAAIPTTIAASPYQKEEIKLESNLETLKRIKRKNENFNNYFVKQIPQINNKNVVFISFKKENEMYLGTWSGAFILDLNNNEIKNIEGIPNIWVWSITFSKTNNDTYFATEQGAYLLKSNENIAKKIDGTEGSVRWIAIDSNNIIYFSIWQRGLFKWENNILTKYNNISGDVHALGIDNEDNIYVGYWNSTKKISVLKKGTTEFTIIEEIPEQKVGIIWFNNKDNSIYIGGANKLYVIKNSKISKIVNFNFGQHHILSIALDSNNNIYFGTEEGELYKLSAGSDTPTKIDEIKTQTRSITVDKNNNVYFGTINPNQGVYIIKNITKFITELEKDKIKLEQNIIIKEIENNKLKAEIQQLKSKNNDLIQENEDKLTNLNSQITKLKNNLNDTNKKVSDFEEEKNKLKQITNDLIEKQDHELKKLNSEIINLNKNKKELENKLEKINLEQNELHKDLIDHNLKIKNFEESKIKLQQVNIDNIKIQKEISIIEEKIKLETEKGMINLWQEMLDIKTNLKRKNDELIKEKEANLKKINLEIEEIEKKFKNTESIIETNKTIITELRNEIKKLMEKINDLEIAREQVIKITSEIKNLTSEEIYKKIKEAYEKGVYILNTEIIDSLFTICPK